MPDLDVVAVITAKPGQESVVRDALNSLVAPTRAEEGCISYDLFESQAEATSFITIEKWRSQADLDEHVKSPHLQTAMQSAGDALGAAPEIHPLTPVS